MMLCALVSACGRKSTPTSLDPKEFIRTAQLPPDLELQLAAQEPNVIDPVSIAFDADGRMYVVEMRDYPDVAAEPRGRVKLLEDRDHDGYYEKATIFADGLLHPTSVLPWRGGVLVTRPPDIMFLKDTDGDNKADQEEILITGFPVENTQHNINGLHWGLDNWVYGANGGNNGAARFKNRNEEISIRGSDFRFNPVTEDLEVSYQTTGGFEIDTDDFGRMFGTHNLYHIRHMVYPFRYLQNNPDFVVSSESVAHLGEASRVGLEDISDHGASAILFQISHPETRVNHPEQAGRFSGGCGITFYGGDALPEDYRKSFFITDVVVNVVHMDRLARQGATFVASRFGENAEFLAGNDNWFRPVNLATGPDGALYLVDMHRGVIEHPEWIPDQVEKTLDISGGKDKGRIYRIVPKGGLANPSPELSGASIDSLVKHLSHPNKWWRTTAQRLLVERQDKSAIAPLVRLAETGASAAGRLHALWTLSAFGALTEAVLTAGLQDEHPGVRENALQMAEGFLEQPPVIAMVQRSAADPDARVRMQAAFSLGLVPKDAHTINALLTILRQDIEIPWNRIAVLSACSGSESIMLEQLLSANDSFISTSTDGKVSLIRELSGIVGRNREARQVAAIIELSTTITDARWQSALLDGLADGIGSPFPDAHNPTLQTGLDQQIRNGTRSVTRAALRVAALIGIETSGAMTEILADAKAKVLNAALPTDQRLEEIGLLALGKYDNVAEVLLAGMDPRHPPELQAAAAEAYIGLESTEQKAQSAISRFRNFSPDVKARMLEMLLNRVEYHELLVSALESGELKSGELNLDLEQRRRLLWHSTDEIKKRASAIFGDHEFSNRDEIVGKYIAEVAKLDGNAEEGAFQYETLCAKCHVFRGQGIAVGPELSMAFAKGTEDLLTSILDPNAAIETQYANYIITTKTGDFINGIITAQTPTSVMLVRASGETNTIPRSQIASMRTDGLSLMPEGLEEGLDAQTLADLVAYLQKHHHHH
jgi:putative membrane-bound dehydrogenase-like protein